MITKFIFALESTSCEQIGARRLLTAWDPGIGSRGEEREVFLERCRNAEATGKPEGAETLKPDKLGG